MESFISKLNSKNFYFYFSLGFYFSAGYFCYEKTNKIYPNEILSPN